MEKQIKKNVQIKTTIKHRAVCEEKDYSGPWRDNKKDANKDKQDHQAQQSYHVIRIETEQSD
jgi:hypothetical protein